MREKENKVLSGLKEGKKRGKLVGRAKWKRKERVTEPTRCCQNLRKN